MKLKNQKCKGYHLSRKCFYLHGTVNLSSGGECCRRKKRTWQGSIESVIGWDVVATIGFLIDYFLVYLVRRAHHHRRIKWVIFFCRVWVRMSSFENDISGDDSNDSSWSEVRSKIEVGRLPMNIGKRDEKIWPFSLSVSDNLSERFELWYMRAPHMGFICGEELNRRGKRRAYLEGLRGRWIQSHWGRNNVCRKNVFFIKAIPIYRGKN